MALVSSSGTTSFAPALGELVLDAFARVQIRAPSLTAEHFFQARLSALMLQSELANVGVPLLFAIDTIDITLQPGVSSYALPSTVVAPLDAFIRQYQMGTAVDFDPVFEADAGSTTVTVTQAAHGLGAGAIAYYTTALAASGQVIQGSYLVTTVVDADTYQIEVPSAMDGTDTVALPVFATTQGSTAVNVTLANHGLSVGGSFYCNVPVEVGGLTLSGQLVVTGVTSTSVFQVTAGSSASTTDSETQNGGQAQMQTQAPGLDATDFIMTQISRNDYASQGDKGPNLQYRPTTFWVDRQITPIVRFWNAPDDNGPYVFRLYFMRQFDDPVIDGGVGIPFPFRWWGVYAAGLAKYLARKYPPPPDSGVSVADIVAEYKELLQNALLEDIERVDLQISPGLVSYFR